MPFRGVVCLAEESEELSAAEKQAAYMSAISGGRLIFVRAVDNRRRSGLIATDSQEWKKVHNDWLDEGRTLLEGKAKQAREFGARNIDTELRQGDKAYELVSVAVERRAGLIVLPNEQSWAISRLFLQNSFSDTLIEHSPCPILWVNK